MPARPPQIAPARTARPGGVRVAHVAIAIVGALSLALLWAFTAPGASQAPQAANPCDKTVSSARAAEAAVRRVAGGKVVCLADGRYEGLELSARGSKGVTLRAKRPGGATIDGAELSGRRITLTRFKVTDDIVIQPGSSKMNVLRNRISGGYMGVDVGPTESTYISDTTIRGNQFVGPFGEDAIRANRYHDGPDTDRYGLLIAGNEFTNIRENGNHSDCLQSVWGGDHLYFMRNYLHDNRCQGFFIKDQPEPIDSIKVLDNLFVRNSAPCDPSFPDCGQPIMVPIGGPIDGLRISRNTIVGDLGFGGDGFSGGEIDHNVVKLLFSGSDLSGFSQHHNVICNAWTVDAGQLPSAKHDTRDCSPRFADRETDDYRIEPRPRAGIGWNPAEQHYGP